jgi:hypothetical protein
VQLDRATIENGTAKRSFIRTATSAAVTLRHTLQQNERPVWPLAAKDAMNARKPDISRALPVTGAKSMLAAIHSCAEKIAIE